MLVVLHQEGATRRGRGRRVIGVARGAAGFWVKGGVRVIRALGRAAGRRRLGLRRWGLRRREDWRIRRIFGVIWARGAGGAGSAGAARWASRRARRKAMIAARSRARGSAGLRGRGVVTDDCISALYVSAGGRCKRVVAGWGLWGFIFWGGRWRSMRGVPCHRQGIPLSPLCSIA